jgi:hypothetical protein
MYAFCEKCPVRGWVSLPVYLTKINEFLLQKQCGTGNGKCRLFGERMSGLS